jgi:hypothetical protein
MTFQHREMAAGRWKELSFFEQMAHIGGEIERTVNWKRKGNDDYSRRAFERALELLDLTITDDRNRGRLKEIVRAREALADHFAFDNTYCSTDSSWQKYFYSFAFAAQNNRQR